MSRIKCIALDFGGTLAGHSRAPDAAAALACLQRLTGKVLDASFAAAVAKGQAQAQELYRRCGSPTSWCEILAAAAQSVGIELPALAGFEERLWRDYPDGEITVEARLAVHALRAAGYVLLLASNTRRPPHLRRETLRKAGLADCFMATVISSELGAGKPDQRFYQAVLEAARRADCEPHATLFVGDSLERDALAPIRHGMHALLISTAACGAVPRISGLARLPEYLGLCT